MRISYKKLKKLPVETTSGEVLGHVDDVVVDVDTHEVAQYEVKASILSSKRYLIARQQVISITSEKMVVDDAVVGEKEDRFHVSRGDVATEAVAMREEVS